MHGALRRILLLAAVVFVAGSAGALRAEGQQPKPPARSDGPILPKPNEVQTLSVQPEGFTLTGEDDSRQMIVTGKLSGDRVQDLSGDVRYEVADAKVVRVNAAGRVLPLANGATEITARYGPHAATVRVEVKAMGENLPINFANQIVPIFTKLGCNSGGC